MSLNGWKLNNHERLAIFKTLTGWYFFGAALIPLLFGGIVMLGWYIRIPELIQINPAFVPMQFNTALGFLMLAMALLAIGFAYTRIAAALALLVVSLASATMGQYLYGFDLGLDQAFMQHYITVETSHPGRMAPNTALCFILTGLAVIISCLPLEKQKVDNPFILLASAVFCLGLLSFVGYLGSVVSAYGWGSYTKMAVHTAVGFIFSGLALLFFALSQKSYSVARQELYQTWLIPVGVFIVVLTAVTFDGERERRMAKHMEREARGLQEQLQNALNVFDKALYRKAMRREADEEKYRRDSRYYLDHFYGLEATGQLSQSGDASKWESNTRLPLSQERYKLLAKKVSLFSSPNAVFSIWVGDQQYLAFSVFVGIDNELYQYMVSLVSIEKIIQSIRKKATYEGFNLEVYVDNDEEPVPHSRLRVDHRFHYEGVNWLLRIDSTDRFDNEFVDGSDGIIVSLVGLFVLALYILQALYIRVRREASTSENLFNQLDRTLNAMIDCVIVIDKYGNIKQVNDAAVTLFGYSKEELLGQNVKCLMPEPYFHQHDQFLENFRKTGEKKILGEPRALKAKKKNGDVFPISLLITKSSGEGEEHFFTGVIHDLSDLNKTIQNKLELEALLNTAMDSSPIGWVILDAHGHIDYANRVLCEWVGLKLDKVIGETYNNIAVLTQGEDFSTAIPTLFKGEEKSLQMEITFVDYYGLTHFGVLSASSVDDEEGKPVKIVAQIVDISRQKNLENDLRVRNSQLERSNQELDQFAYVASHDLKSPLNAIEKLTGWIQEDCGNILPETSKPHLELLKGRVKRMAKLLDDLLMYSRVGRVEYTATEVNLAAMCEDIFNLLNVPSGFEIKAEDKPLLLPPVPFELVLRNLISNAIKHHDKDKGLIEISVEEKNSYYVIQVKDDGPGIPEKLHAKALEMFQTLKPRDEVEGSGMGLALCKKTVEFYGGSLEIQSDGRCGTVIFFSWLKGSRG